KQLVKLWEKEAKENNVYPLTDHFLNAIANLPPDNLRARKTFVFYPEMSHLSESAAPLTTNRSYDITIPITHSAEDEGVLRALGNDKSGYTLYIKDNKLVYEYNAGTVRYRIVSEKELVAGEIEVQFSYEKTGNNQGIGNLFVNKESAGIGEMTTPPLQTSFDGLDICQHVSYPVSDVYVEYQEHDYSG